MPEFWYYAKMQAGPDVARYVHVTGDHDGVRAAWERLGFEPVSGWSLGDAVLSTLFRAGPAFVELVDRASVREQARPADAALVAG
jgi:hypothetical protein